LFPLMEDVTDLLLTGRAQLGICYKNENPHREIVTYTLGEVAMPIVVSTEHPLARKQPLNEIDLQGSRQLLVTGRREGSERQRFRLSAQVWWVEGDLGVMELVKRGLGWAAIPAFLIQEALARQEVVVLESDLISRHALTLELQWHRALALGQAGRWLKETLQSKVPF
ncbi:substrate-binding domain-containing protein, partial [Shewanella sp. SR1]|uniref:substrate-binding domain-containing protein n=1 Tax=Shewanella sp. SR1 TaxID=2855505 RepID=UPI001CF339E4